MTSRSFVEKNLILVIIMVTLLAAPIVKSMFCVIIIFAPFALAMNSWKFSSSCHSCRNGSFVTFVFKVTGCMLVAEESLFIFFGCILSCLDGGCK